MPPMHAPCLLSSTAGGQAVPATILALALIIAAGLALGSLRIRGVGLGVAGVLFSGLLAARMGVAPDPALLAFLRDLGLVLFVFTIGLQIGPGFLGSVRRAGLKLNLLAVAVVTIGTLSAASAVLWMPAPAPLGVGLLTGATTNTPSLAAAEQTLRERGAAPEAVESVGAGYALAYPVGILATIGVLVVLNRLPSPRARSGAGTAHGGAGQPEAEAELPRVTVANLEVTNPNLVGVAIARLPLTADAGVVISRHWHAGTTSVPTGAERLALGDVLLAVGAPDRVDRLRMLVGRESELNLREEASGIVTRRAVVTRSSAVGASVAALDLPGRFGVTITRVERSGVELTPTPSFRLNFADALMLVGPEDRVREASLSIGNNPARLQHPGLIAIFVGIALGVLLGGVPIHIPWLPGAVKLGLAAGPLLVAIVMANLHRIGPLVVYLPLSANFTLREIGIALFLACVGLNSAGALALAVSSPMGLVWLGVAAVIAAAPLLMVAIFARLRLGMDTPTLSGVLAGSMTDPPALAFATALNKTDAPAAAYATVYPLTMILRIVLAQAMVILMC